VGGLLGLLLFGLATSWARFANCALTVQQRFRERLSARQLGLACAWRCRAREHPDGTRPPPSGV